MDAITVQGELKFENPADRLSAEDLMRRFSAAVRFAFRRLLEGMSPTEIRKAVARLFGLNARYADGAVLLAQSLLSSCRERGQNPRKVIFGGRDLFEQLQRGHLSGPRRKELKEKWREKRQGHLFTRGQRIAQTRKALQEEKNVYKRNALRSRLQRLCARRALASLSREGEPVAQQPVDRGKEPVRGRLWRRRNDWRVLSAALAVPFLEKFPWGLGPPRDFSPSRWVRVVGDGEPAVSRLAPVQGAGAAA